MKRYQKNNYKRDRIKNEHLLDFVDHIDYSERNKTIMKRYTSGQSYKEIAGDYGITPERVNNIVANCVTKCAWYRKKHSKKTTLYLGQNHLPCAGTMLIPEHHFPFLSENRYPAQKLR